MPARPFRVGRSLTGLGLFAVRPTKRREYIVTYSGPWIGNDEADRLERRGARYLFGVNSEWTINGASRRNLGRYANHSWASLTALFATPRARGGGAESGPSFGCFGPGRPPPISIWLDRGRRALTGGVFEADRPHTCSTSAATGEFIKKNNRRPARRSAKIHRTAANG
jgi:hypothetical protein